MIRTLLVDNYDSFTYNVFHYLAEVNGRPPDVIRNDEPGWHPALLDAFDNVVLSPGPGTPEKAEDVGHCRDIIAHGTLPLLGICLGHQGVALAHGARVTRAPEPRHGRTSAVRHDGTGLFTGLDSPLRVARYHSLAVTELPADLHACAWDGQGVCMALRHIRRPQWGVQFHPESIGTQQGHRLLRNFRDLTERHHQQVAPHRQNSRRSSRRTPTPADRAATPDTPTGQDTGPDEARHLRVLVREVSTPVSGESAFDSLFRTGTHAFWLDSSHADTALGRFSIMGDAAGPLARVATADAWNTTVTIRDAHTTRTVPGAFFSWLEADLRSLRVDIPPLPCDFALGWVGYLGYELKAECGGDAAHRSTEPDATMVFTDHALVLDQHTGTSYLLALTAPDEQSAARAWLDHTATALAALASNPPAGTAPSPAPAGGGDVTLRHSRAAYLKLVDTCQEAIAAGESYEICLTNQLEAGTTPDPWQAYRHLRHTSPAPFAALLRFGDLSVLSSSPERFLRVRGDGTVEATPIKGTRPRGGTAQQDARLAAELERSEKDRAENLMIVDLVRHDLGRCAEVGSVRADDIFRVESYATVHQLVSTVRAQLRPEHGAVACVRAAFPGGSMTGAPKIRTMRLIDQLEASPRGVYSGAIGYFSLSGAADWSIVIRTAVLTGDRVRYGVGGAVIALSDPAEEFEETAVKAAPLLTLLGATFPE